MRPARSGLEFPTECPRGARRSDPPAASAFGACCLSLSSSVFWTASSPAPGQWGSPRGRVTSAGHDPPSPVRISLKMAAESGELIGACEFMKGEEQLPRLLQPSFAPDTSLLAPTSQPLPPVSPGNPSVLQPLRALSAPLTTILSPRTPCFRLLLSFLRPSFPLQLPWMASPPGLGTPPASAALLHAEARGDSARGDLLGPLYLILTCWPRFSGHPPITPSCLSSLPFLEVSGAAGEGSPLYFSSATAEGWRFLNQTCISSSTATPSFYQLRLVRNKGDVGDMPPTESLSQVLFLPL